MRIVGLEEHFATREVLDAWLQLPSSQQDLALQPSTRGETGRRLLDLGDERFAAMQATGVDAQVLSLTPPGLQGLPEKTALALQRSSNDFLADVVASSSGRYQGLAVLATSTPKAAADELGRAVRELGLDGAMVYGRTGATQMDHPDYWPIYEAAEALRAPLHLHPQSPPIAVREAYYDGFAPATAAGFATAGIGWHYETAVQLVRMLLAGVFDRFPDLQVIVGHWGEVVLFYLERVQQLAERAGVAHSLQHYVRQNLHLAPSGMLSRRYLRWALEVAGPDRLLFSTDYPFEAASQMGARTFLEYADLDGQARTGIASGNWERLRTGIRR